MPHTTEEAIKKYAEQQRIQMTTNKIETDNSNHVKKRLMFLSSTKNLVFSRKNV